MSNLDRHLPCIISIIGHAIWSSLRWFWATDFQRKNCLCQHEPSRSLTGRSTQKECRQLSFNHSRESWDDTMQPVLDHLLLSAWRNVDRLSWLHTPKPHQPEFTLIVSMHVSFPQKMCKLHDNQYWCMSLSHRKCINFMAIGIDTYHFPTENVWTSW